MSCFQPIESYTNAKYLYRGVSRFRQSFSCGKCAACQSKQRTDWRVRAYYEALGCLERCGFVLFDTLTYCDDYIKHYSDIFPDMAIPSLLDNYCFSRDDVQKFFKRLRINLKRAGYKYDTTQLRYILSSEYGSSEQTFGFQNTHRPHYHLLFFVTFDIKPVDFSRFVSQAWHLGKTDGVRPYDDCALCPVRKFCKGKCLYQSADYVIKERLVSNNSRANCIKCVNYVTKYISKDMYMTDKLERAVDDLWQYLYPEFRTDLELYRKYRVFRSQVLPFHLQSQGFGLHLLRTSERAYLLATNQVHLPTADVSVVRSVALPRYYQRKLYYDYKKVDGRVQWYLTDFGIEQRLKQLDSKIEAFKRDYRAFDIKISDSKLQDLALYKLVYKGTLTDWKSLYMPYKKYYRAMIQPHLEAEQPLYFNRNTYKDKITIGRFLSTRYVVNGDGEIIYKGKQFHKEFVPYDGYMLVSDKVCPYWRGFDSLLLSYQRHLNAVGFARDVKQYQDDLNKDYYKRLGLLKS